MVVDIDDGYGEVSCASHHGTDKVISFNGQWI